MASEVQLWHGASVRFELKNERPVEVEDLTTSLLSFSQQYQRFAQSYRADGLEDGTKLYISEIRSGSIIAELMSAAEQLSWVVDHKEIIAGFVSHLNDLFQIFLRGREPPPTVDKTDLTQLSQIIEPVAKDESSQLNISVNSGGAPITINITSAEANAIQNRIARSLNKIPEIKDTRFRKEILTLYQARDDARARTGDKGRIEKFSPRPLKLLFANEEAKRAILEGSENPFRLAFVVDGEVVFVDGKPAVFKIFRVHDHFERP